MKMDKVIVGGLAIIAVLLILMIIGGACAACFLCSFIPANIKTGSNIYPIEHREDKTIHAAATSIDLDASTIGGNVEIQESTSGDVEVVYDVYASQGRLGDIVTSTNYSQAGDTLQIKTEARLAHPEDLPFAGTRGAHVYVKVPKNATVSMTLHTLGGNIIVPERSGSRAYLSTLGGNIDLNGQYDNVYASTAGGDITSRYGSTNATFSTLGGKITLYSSQTAGKLKATTMGGNVYVRLPTDTLFSVDASTMGGRVRHGLIHMASTTENSQHLVGHTEAGAGNLSVALSTMGGDVEISY